MTLEDVRERLERSWLELDRSLAERKDSHGTVTALIHLYRTFSSEERSLANHVICDWLTSATSRKQFDALVLVDEFQIKEAIPVLRALQRQFEQRNDHQAPYDWARVNRILARLAGDGPAT